jgi:hypothetical protein
MPRLRSCQGCSRHVYESETVCPFCKMALAPALQRAQPKVPSGLSRAQRLAMAAALAGPLAACPDDGTNPTTPNAGASAEAGTSAAEGGAGGFGQAGTGAAAGKGAAGKGGAAGKASGESGHVAVPLYGAPLAGNRAFPTAGTAGGQDEDAGQAGEGGSAGGGHVVHPLYGAPVPLYGAPAPRK